MSSDFERLSKKQRRIAVAKDVLRWLKLGRMTAKRRTYLRANTLTPEGKINGYNCQACALGGLFACAVEQKKGFSLLGLSNGYGNDYGTQDQMHKALSGFFTRDELMNIENAFEGRTSDGWLVNGQGDYDDEDNFSKAAATFNAGVPSAKKRMQRIMRNIVRNNGRFVP